MDPTALLMIALFVALGYFMLVRPARQQQKKQAALMRELEPGQRVTTQIGLYGTLVELGEVLARLEVAPGTVITVDKRLVTGVVPRSRDEFWTYPDEPESSAEVATDDVEHLTLEGEPATEPTPPPTTGEPTEDLAHGDTPGDDRKA